MSKIKICGLTRLEDAIIVNEGRPDYVGFILTPSKRQVTVFQAATISRLLLPSIQRVGVFAKETAEEIAETASLLDLDGIQLHFDTTPEFLTDLKKQISHFWFPHRPFLWQRIPVPACAQPQEDLIARIASFADLTLFDGLLLDTCQGGRDGGTGKTFSWQSAGDFVENISPKGPDIIVAGGLTPENVADAVAFFEPYAVDVSSGVETGGIKDRNKVLRFIENARKA